MNDLSKGSLVDPTYSSGQYYQDPNRHSQDAAFKAENFWKIFLRFVNENEMDLRSYVDVGCGAGTVAHILPIKFREVGWELEYIKGYDVSPCEGSKERRH